MKTRTMLFPVVALCMYSVAWADSPFDGTWQLNTAKSNLTGDTMSFEDAGSGQLKYTDSSQSYSFKPDGSSFTTPLGVERTFKKTGDSTYSTTNTVNGRLDDTNTWKLSADGKTLVIESKGTKPNGDTFDDVTTYVRTSSGTGLIGGWKNSKVKLSSPNTLTFQINGNDFTLAISDIKGSCRAKLDGKDYPCAGPTVPDGITVAITKTGANSLKLVEKSKSKVLAIIHYQVAADGKTMNIKGSNGEGKEPWTEVREKQS